MRRVIAIVLSSFLLAGSVVSAQSRCNQSAVINVAGGATGTIIAAVAGAQIDVCGFLVTGTVNGTTVTFNAGTTATTGAFYLNAGIPLSSPTDFAFIAPLGAAVTLAAGTGTVTGLITYRQ